MSATVTINTTGLVNGTLPGTYIRIDLQNCSNGRVVGSGQIVPQSISVAPVNGTVTVTLYDNQQITCGTINVQGNCGCTGDMLKTSFYTFSFVYQGVVETIGSYNLKPGTYNLWDLTPCIGADCIDCNQLSNVSVYTQTPVGIIDGVNRVFTLRFAPTVLWLQLGGVFMTEVNDYTLVDNVITMTEAPIPGFVFTAVYTYGAYVPNILTEIPSGLVNGVNRVFTVTQPINQSGVWLYVNGTYQTNGVDYLIGPANTITFTIAPLTGSGLYIDYITGTGGDTFSNITTEVPSGVIDGVNATFTLSKVPSYLMLQQNQGLLQPGVGFTRTGVTVTLAIPPSIGDVLFATLFN